MQNRTTNIENRRGGETLRCLRPGQLDAWYEMSMPTPRRHPPATSHRWRLMD